MSCDKYRPELLEIAAAGEQAREGLAHHLGECRDCAAVLQSEQELLVHIESALRERASLSPSPGFLARLRTEISRETERRAHWNPAWVWAAAALVLITTGVANLQSFSRKRPLKAAIAIPIPLPKTAPQASTLALQIVPSPRVHMPVHTANANPTAAYATQGPEVLVPPEEAEAFRKFVEHLSQHQEVAEALVTRVADPEDGDSFQIPPVQIASLHLKPLVWEKWK